MPGARINYSIAVNATGSGTATNVVFTDNIPANTTYVPGSLALNAVAVTDAVDPADDGDYVGCSDARACACRSARSAPPSGTQTITFTVTIN